MDINKIIGEYEGYKYIDGNKPLENLEDLLDTPKKEWNTEDLALVHATNLFPDGVILNNLDGGKVFENEISINGEKKKYSAHHPRKTTHFTLNGIVGNNDGGSWNNMDYIVIEPLKNHINNVTNLHNGDTYFDKSVQLSEDAVYLISKNAFDNIDKAKLERKNVIIFDGDQEVVVHEVLLSMGYYPQKINNWGWSYNKAQYFNTEYSGKFLEYVNKEIRKNPKLTGSIHHGSYYNNMDNKIYEVTKILSAIRNGETISLKNENIITKDEILVMYKHYISSSMNHYQMGEKIIENIELSDNINTFKNFISLFNIQFNNGEYYVSNVETWYDKEHENNIIKNNFIESLYFEIKELEKIRREQKEQNEQLEKELKIKEILEKISNLEIEQAYKIVEELPEYSKEIKVIINSMLRCSVAGIGNSINITENNIRFIIGDDSFYDFVCNIPNIIVKNDGLCILENAISKNTTLLEAQKIINYYNDLYHGYLVEKPNDIQGFGFGNGFIKIRYIIIFIFITILFFIIYLLHRV